MGWKTLCIGLGALALLGCGDDKAPATGAACPAGTAAGAEVPCDCADAGPVGVAICQDTGTLTACDCSGDAGSGGAGGSTGGSGGTAGNDTGTGGMGGTGGTGGSGGTTPDDDGGMDPEPDAAVPMQPLPDDGNQGAVCEDAVDCNQGLDCYNPGASGQGFCSATCTEDADCESLAGAAYTCSMSTGVCHVECEGQDDADSCPDQMECVATSGGGGGGGPATFRCKFPDAPAPTGTQSAFEECSTDLPCEDGLVCSGGGFGAGGYCTIACVAADADSCADISAPSGDLEPACTMAFGGPGGGMGGRCTLDCSDDAEGCPEGMTCIDSGMTQRCGYE